MTDVITYDVQRVLNEGNPQDFPNAAHAVGIGNVLAGLVTEISDTGTVPGTPFKFALSKTPVPGTLRVASGAAVLSEYVGASAVAATQFKTSVVSGVTYVTPHSGTEGDAYVCQYLTLDDCGPDGATKLVDALAETYNAG